MLVYQSGPLDQDLTLVGPIQAKFFVSTTGTDSDWIIKLIDVYPDEVASQPHLGGYQLPVAEDIFRGRYREGFEIPKPIAANDPT